MTYYLLFFFFRDKLSFQIYFRSENGYGTNLNSLRRVSFCYCITVTKYYVSMTASC